MVAVMQAFDQAWIRTSIFSAADQGKRGHEIAHRQDCSFSPPQR